ncbi:MAG: S8 family serine peptidase, partial [Acidobacteriota bacterium]
MFTETYAVLRSPRADSTDPTDVYRSGEVLSYGLEVASKSPDGEVADREGREIEVEVEQLGPDEAEDLLRDKEVKGLAPVMELQLIEPVEHDDDEGDQESLVARSTPADSKAWGVQAVGASTCPYSGEGITVAVLDSGIEAGHPAFHGVDLIQKDFTLPSEPNICPDDSGHGTHCAGTLFGRSVEGHRIGVAPGVQKAVIGKVFGKNGGGTTAELYSAIDWAADEGAQIISMSMALNFASYLQLMEDRLPRPAAISKALATYRENMLFIERMAQLLEHHPKVQPLVIAAAGNDSQRDADEPYEIDAGMPAVANGIVSVGALRRNSDKTLSVARFSNIGVDVAAPGQAIYSAKMGGGLGYKSGTSMAAPHVAGVAALWAQKMMQRARGLTRGSARVDPGRLRS